MIKTSSRRMLAGSGTMTGLPPMTQFKRVVKLIKTAFIPFLKNVYKEKISNENGLNRQLSRHITNISYSQNLPFFADSEAMEDETRGSSPATDIGIYLRTENLADAPPRITVFEGKRLSNGLRKSRQKEYVVGREIKGKHVVCGGIERFKCSIHGRDFKCAGMIGYIQDETADHWLNNINGWVTELSNHCHAQSWRKDEHLLLVKSEGKISECSSVVFRKSDTMNLTHLWVDLQP